MPNRIRVLGVAGFSTVSFLVVACSRVDGWVLFGVVCASVADGLGEITFLSLTACYHKSTVSGWSSGTGAAGVIGALLYAAFRTFLSVKVTLLIQTFIPALMLLSYLFLLGPAQAHTPEKEEEGERGNGGKEEKEEKEEEGKEGRLHTQLENKALLGRGVVKKGPLPSLRLKGVRLFHREEAEHWLSHVKYTPRLFKYMLPFFVVYFAEYAINQSFFELLYNANTHLGGYCLDQRTQYRWLQVIFRVGMLISISILYIKHYWVLSLLQVSSLSVSMTTTCCSSVNHMLLVCLHDDHMLLVCLHDNHIVLPFQLANFVFFFCASIYLFLPSFWLTFVLVLYEGLLGGGVYVSAFYTITLQVSVSRCVRL